MGSGRLRVVGIRQRSGGQPGRSGHFGGSRGREVVRLLHIFQDSLGGNGIGESPFTRTFVVVHDRVEGIDEGRGSGGWYVEVDCFVMEGFVNYLQGDTRTAHFLS